MIVELIDFNESEGKKTIIEYILIKKFKSLSLEKIQIKKISNEYFFKTIINKKIFIMIKSHDLDFGMILFLNKCRYEKNKLWKKTSSYYLTNNKTKNRLLFLEEKYKKSEKEINDFFDNWSWNEYKNKYKK